MLFYFFLFFLVLYIICYPDSLYIVDFERLHELMSFKAYMHKYALETVSIFTVKSWLLVFTGNLPRYFFTE